MTALRNAADNAFDARMRTPFATLGVRTEGAHVTHISFLPAETAALAPKKNSLAYLVCVQLSQYLDDPSFEFDLPVRLAGSRHELRVWEAMRAIPAGETKTYGELAAAIASSARAVGSACGANPVPIVVPCHRVVAANGLGGFMGGRSDDTLHIKRWLLAHEQRPFILK